ncbi:hypothetical protein [Amnibacterium setariae]|uniref:Uncharacterized protein n=1 Tax=Amnibacterium setariae TaxID=2306585 RepID=A0A3A1U154_9MICO|nr:hypothetical protein [Amnibacterium setariae]RIX27547.1 hypothetical protein D1781_08180 [Amnibacterium setariae]
MHLTALRTAAVAGTCAVALSFVALPAQAATVSHGSHSGSEPSSSQTETSSSSSSDDASSGTDVGDDHGSGTEVGDDHGDGTEVGDDDGTDATDESGDSDESDDSGDDASDDQGGDDADGSSAPVALPAEQGSPSQAFRRTVLLPKEIRTKGIKVVYSGLTRKAHYQPYFSGGRFGGEIGEVRKANGKGAITLTIHPRKDLAFMTQLGASFVIGLRGLDTQLDLTQRIEVKYDSDVALTTKRRGEHVSLAVAVDHETRSGDDSAWKKVRVRFQKKVDGKWVTVKTVRTDAKGVAKAKVTAGRSEWRAVVVSGRTVAGTTTRGHRR